ncbi:STAS domain-containing protein [Dactylosporangium sp. NPDC050688]|uniref:STAS domain-containing protein n=1 Tax=Dactylosporangium sp. NPDC050688 TaxID=3157217 RepID=UPI0033F9B49D
MTFSAEVQPQLDDQIVIVLRGELQQTTAAKFRQVITDVLATCPAQLVIDLNLITFLDSSGLGALVSARHACDETGCRVAVSGLNPAVRRTLHTTGLTDYLNAHETP